MKTREEIKEQLAEQLEAILIAEDDNGFNLDEFQRQGIINNFVAAKIAFSAGQISSPKTELHSEDLY